MEACSCNWE